MVKHNVTINRRPRPIAIKAGVSKRKSVFKNGGKLNKNKC